MQELKDAEDEESGFKIIAERLAEMEESRAKQLSLEYAKQQVALSLHHPSDQDGARLAIWYPILDGFLEAESAIDRFICHKTINLLVERALFKRDFKTLEALATVTKELKNSQYQKNQTARVIAAEILYWEPYLAKKLGHPPTKLALKGFLTGLEIGLSSRDADWSKAHSILGNSNSTDRTGKRVGGEVIARLALEARRFV